jgi:hypothetical protein
MLLYVCPDTRVGWLWRLQALSAFEVLDRGEEAWYRRRHW